MKLYQVSSKYGRSPYQIAAYVEAGSAKEAIIKYCGGEDQYQENIDEGFKYRATLTELPEGFWDRADNIRPDYIAAPAAYKSFFI